jgi:hypothetical protein
MTAKSGLKNKKTPEASSGAEKKPKYKLSDVLCTKTPISRKLNNIGELLTFITQINNNNEISDDQSFHINDFENTYQELRQIKTYPFNGENCIRLYYLMDNLELFIKTGTNFKDGRPREYNYSYGGSRAKSKFSRKYKNRHLSGKNRKHTLKRLHKKQKTNKNRNSNNIRKRTQKRN